MTAMEELRAELARDTPGRATSAIRKRRITRLTALAYIEAYPDEQGDNYARRFFDWAEAARVPDAWAEYQEVGKARLARVRLIAKDAHARLDPTTPLYILVDWLHREHKIGGMNEERRIVHCVLSLWLTDRRPTPAVAEMHNEVQS